ncbi:hypothetical protein HUS23_04615 [Ectothiorhodospiraceae bacterium 2226]|nr:hypothetical protein HUS23_04615 [Ectothiorhodospiraceae bacterium 2226]
MKTTTLLVVLALFLITPVHAWELRPTAGFGYDAGGDERLLFQNGDGNGLTLRAGSGLHLSAGIALDLDAAKRFESQLTGGYRLRNVHGDGYLERFPIDSLFFFRHSDHRLGGGFTYHFNPRLATGGLLAEGDTRFDDALGYVLQYDYRITDNGSVGMRYLRLDYHTRGTGETLEAGSFGFYLNSRF